MVIPSENIISSVCFKINWDCCTISKVNKKNKSYKKSDVI